ncbi:MAG: hypothetical protein ACRCSR_07595 [Bacteroidales bacterium]
MRLNFNNILAQIQDKGVFLCKELRNKGFLISQSEGTNNNRPILQQTKKSHFSANGKAFIIIGIFVLLITMSSMLKNENSFLFAHYLLLIISIALIIYGFKNNTKIKLDESSKKQIDFDEIEIRYIDEMSRLISIIADEWEAFMTSKKKELQELINDSELSQDEKSKAFSHTYYIEMINKSCYELIKVMRNIEKDNNYKINADKAISDFINLSEINITEIVTHQLNNYRKINL